METPIDYGPSSVPLATSTPPLPFLLKVVVAFLAADGLERCWTLIQWAQRTGEGSELTASAFDVGGPLGLLAIGITVLLEVILILLILLRTWWGRIWTQTVVGIHLVYVGALVLVQRPELWLYLSEPARLRLAATFVVDALILGYLATPAARRALDR